MKAILKRQIDIEVELDPTEAGEMFARWGDDQQAEFLIAAARGFADFSGGYAATQMQLCYIAKELAKRAGAPIAREWIRDLYQFVCEGDES